MKSAVTRITAIAIAKLLGLPDGVRVDAVFQDAEDHLGDSFTFRIRGAGQEHIEGCHIRYHTLAELIANPPPLNIGCQLVGMFGVKEPTE